MAAAVDAPTGKAAGRVTITGLAVGLIPPLVTIAVLIILALLELISAEVAGAAALAVLANAGLTSGSVFVAQKNTPTDQKVAYFSSSLAEGMAGTGQTTPTYVEPVYDPPLEPTSPSEPVEADDIAVSEPEYIEPAAPQPSTGSTVASDLRAELKLREAQQ